MGTRPHSTRAAIVTMVLLTSAHAFARAQNVRAGRTGSLNATRVDQSVRVDGKLDEPFWRLVRPVGRFTQSEPVEGNAPTKPTDVRLVFTDDAVVIGARLEDDAHVLKDAVSIVGTGMLGMPGIAGRMFRALADAGVNIETMFPAGADGSKVRMAFGVDNAEAAARALG